MSRLLFAAARGARIQNSYHNWKCGGSEWREANLNMLAGARIHPEDEPLQYGPISSALRDPDEEHCTIGNYPSLALHASVVSGLAWTWARDWLAQPNELHRSLFLLILAEALADEGL